MENYPTFAAVIDAFGGSGPFGDAIGKPIGTASAMKTRNVIPPAHWDAVVSAAAKMGLPEIDHALLSRLYSDSRRRSRAA